MSKKIEFDYEDKHYVLEYNREAIKFMENEGFVLSEVDNKPAIMLDLAFKGAFYKNHKGISLQKIAEIFDILGDKQKLSANLMAMINETYMSLLEDNKDNKEKNIVWKAV